MFIGARKRDIGIVNRKSAETGAKNHKAVVEVPSPPATTTTSTTSETWDM